MSPLQLVLVALFAALAAGVTALDAARRGRSRLAPALGVGAVVLAASLGLVAGDAALLSGYAALTGRSLVASTPRELFGLTAAAVAVVSVATLSGYGALSRLSRPA